MLINYLGKPHAYSQLFLHISEQSYSVCQLLVEPTTKNCRRL